MVYVARQVNVVFIISLARMGSTSVTWIVLCCLLVSLVRGGPSAKHHTVRSKRQADDLTPGNWDSCKEGAEAPPTRVDTAQRVDNLTNLFTANGNIAAYIIPSEDAHQSEYPSNYDKRREFISGFAGSAGMAVVTSNKAALWTDGRYFLQAEAELDCSWILMRQGEAGVPTVTEWLNTELASGGKVGASPFLMSNSRWKSYQDALDTAIVMTPVLPELIDQIWNADRPSQPNSVINALPMEFAGRSWQDKVSDTMAAMETENVDLMVVTGLDETAWLFNLRASDISYNPFFISYAVIDKAADSVTLYLLNHEQKLTQDPSDNETTVTVSTHLNTSPTGSCAGRTGRCVEVKGYSPATVQSDIATRVNESDINKVWVSFSCNYAIVTVIPEAKVHEENTPLATSKSKKNAVERQGMINSHIRDAVALISFIAKLEAGVLKGDNWTEVSAAEELKKFRQNQQYNRGLSFPSISSSGANGAIIHYRPTAVTDTAITTDHMYLLDSGGQYLQQEYNRGLSFTSISGVGSNGAIIHYSPSPATDKAITTEDMYLLDSGGQYLDGTTDVTRTFHFGEPTAYEKECYTRVLMGHIDLFQAIWAKGLYGREIDAFARGPLWNAGLVYRHGTGHGIGMYLSVHEGPGRISLSHSSFISDYPLQEYQFFSDEPGYYEDGKFGIRLENIVMVKNATTKYHFEGADFLTFDHVTLAPYEPKLIDFSLLNEKQVQYLNDYNKKIRDIVGPELQRQGQTEGYNWMMTKTETISTTSSAAIFIRSSSMLSVLLTVCAYFFM